MALQIRKPSNPYHNTNGIKDSTLFFNRKTLIGTLLNLLFSGSTQCLSLVGPRKSGKTALVEYLTRPDTIAQFKYDDSQHLFVSINCAKHPDALKSREGFYRLLLRSLHTKVAKLLPDIVNGASINTIDPISWQEEWDSLLQELSDLQFSIVVTLDAFDSILDEKQPITEGLFGSLRAYGEEPNFAWITCTFEPLPLLFQKAYKRFDIPEAKRWSESEFHSTFTGYYVMNLFSLEDIGKIIAGPSTAQGISFSQSEQRAIRQFGGRFPYFIQRACYHFFEAHLRGEEIQHEEILTTCHTEASSLWEGYWKKLSSQQQMLLFSIASGHPVEGSPAVQSLKDAALIYEEYGCWLPFSEEFGRFVLTKEHAYVGRPVNPGELL